MPTTAERMSEAMHIRKIVQSELCRKTGIGKSSISTYLSGEYKPKQRNLYKIAKALDVTPEWLMGLDVPMNANVAEKNDTEITDEELSIVEAYRSASHLEREMTRRCLGLEGAVEEEADRICECINEEFNLSAPKIIK